MQNSDILIIGGGVIGLSIARELRRRGIGRIALFDRGEIGKESSYAAAGMLAPHAESDKADDFFRFCVESCRLYPNFAAELLDETGVDIELDRSGTLYLAFTKSDSADLRRRLQWQSTAGFSVEHLSTGETLKAEPFISSNVRESLFFPDDWQVENRKLLEALTRYARINGIDIHESTGVRRIIVENGQVGGVESEKGIMYSDRLVLATGAWTSLIKLGENALPVEVRPIRGQMISFQTAKRSFQRVIYSRRGYIVPRSDGRILAGATVEDVGFEKTTTYEGIAQLQSAAIEISPSLSSLEILDRWAGLRPFAADGLPIMGDIPGVAGLTIATAHYRNGILLAPITARVVADRVVGTTESPFMKIFGPKRFIKAAS